MTKSICIYFQVHQPMRFRSYRFFEIGKQPYYYDDYLNESIVNRVAQYSYLPANKMLQKLIKTYGDKIKIAFSISGIALDQFKLHAPEVIKSFQELHKTGAVEFLTEPYSHSLAVFKDSDEFNNQVTAHSNLIEELFDTRPKCFRNTELIYTDHIGQLVNSLGYKTILTEGAKHILGGQSPNKIYHGKQMTDLKLLLRNNGLSDDIFLRSYDTNWQEYPVNPKKVLKWSQESLENGENLNLFFSYEIFGYYNQQNKDLLKLFESYIKEIIKTDNIELLTPSEVAEKYTATTEMSIQHPISWSNEEKDLSVWFGNDLQEDAYNRLYSVLDKIKKCRNPQLLNAWKYLQTSDHFSYMSTNIYNYDTRFSSSNPFNSPYDAYINYMNILSDFIIQLNTEVPETKKDYELATLASIIYEKDIEIEKQDKEIKSLKSKLQNIMKVQARNKLKPVKSDKNLI